MENIKEELYNNNLLIPISIEGIEQILFQMKNCICKIYKNEDKIGVGFFCKIPFKDNFLNILVTNSSILNENDLKGEKNIIINISNNKKGKNIKIDSSRIKFTDPKLGLTFIEIRPIEDDIHYFLDIDNLNYDKNISEKAYTNNSIYILHYLKENNVNISYGSSNKLLGNFIYYNCSIDATASGAPILSLETFKVIGINNGSQGIIIKDLINEFYKAEYNKEFLSSNNIEKYNILNEMTIIYRINDNDNEIKLFGNDFVNHNKENCFLSINGKNHEFCEYLYKEEINNNQSTIEIKLKEIKTMTNLSYMFYYCLSLISLPDISEWNMSNVTDLSYIFSCCESLTNLSDISKWDISKVTNLSYMFDNCKKLSTLPDISIWSTNNVTDMSYLFNFCISLTNLPDISKWNIIKVKNMSYLFSNCVLLSNLPDISKWNTANVSDMNNMFNFCESLKSFPDISKWDTSKVKNMRGMFCICESVISLPDISSWNTSNVTDMSYMFCNCTSLTHLPDISKWDTNSVININDIFSNCISLLYLPDISKWRTSHVIDMSYVFNNCMSLSYLPDISKWDTSNVTSMLGMFCSCESLTVLPDISKWNVNKVSDISGIFNFCESLTILPNITKWNITNVTETTYMLDRCISLVVLPKIKFN